MINEIRCSKCNNIIDFSVKEEKIKQETTQNILQIIEKKIEIIKEERILWENNLLRNGKSIKQKGCFKNPDFQIQANAMIYILEELNQEIVNETRKIKRN